MLNVNAEPTQQLSSKIEYSCGLNDEQRAIDCSYRFIEATTIKKIHASVEDLELPILDIKTYPFQQSHTNILFLVESQTSENINKSEAIKNHLKSIAEQSLDYQQIGLASFANNLRVFNPVGTPAEEIINNISAINETTQQAYLNRNILAAINLLDQSQADRKAIYLFANNENLDQNVTDQQVINTAKQANIKIIVVAYPISNSKLPLDNSETLRKLAVETGGIFIEATGSDFELTDTFLTDPFAVIDNGGILSLDLNPILSTDFQGPQLVSLEFETNKKRITLKIPLEISVSESNFTAVKLNGETTDEVSEIIEQPVQVVHTDTDPEQEVEAESTLATETGVENPQITTETSTNSSTLGKLHEIFQSKDYKELLLNYWPVFPAAILIIGLIYTLFRKKPEVDNESTDSELEVEEIKPPKEVQPLAWLVSLTDDTLSYPITGSSSAIGRTRDNDIIIEHSSVSRKHAELKQSGNDYLEINDLDSLNGVYINNSKVASGLIRHEDRVDIGDVRLKLIFKI